MRKKAWCLAVTACMLIGSTCTVHAEDKAYEGTANFDGRAIQSDFTQQDILNEIGSMEPGDSVQINLNLKNTSGKTTDWYMTNTASSLEYSQSRAKDGAYTYLLTYTAPGGAMTTLYDSDTVGGDTAARAAAQEIGLNEAVASMQEYFYLGTLSSSDAGRIMLKVSLDGETQGNSYQDSLAKLQMNFAVELRENGGGGGSRSGGSGGSGGGGTPSGSAVYSPGAVQTGDNAQIVLWSTVGLAAGLILLVFAVISHRREQKEAQR